MVDYAEKTVHTPAAILLQKTGRATNLNTEERGFVARFLDGNSTPHVNYERDARETLTWADLLARDPQALKGLMELDRRKGPQPGWNK